MKQVVGLGSTVLGASALDESLFDMQLKGARRQVVLYAASAIVILAICAIILTSATGKIPA